MNLNSIKSTRFAYVGFFFFVVVVDVVGYGVDLEFCIINEI